MSFNLEPVISILLHELIEVVPPHTQLEPYRDNNLNLWRSSGAYSLHKSDNKSFSLQVNQREYAAVLYAEAQHLMNHAAEHRAHLVARVDLAEPSPSWVFVTIYYMSLYIAMAFTRVANIGILYLDKDAVEVYCRGAPKKPGAGAFECSAYSDFATNIPYVKFKKCGSNHFHEAVWTAVHNKALQIFNTISESSELRKPTEEEVLSLRALKLFFGLSFSHSTSWPSAFRNGINYRPGFSYRSILKNNFLRISLSPKRPTLNSLEDIIVFGERAKHSVRGLRNVFDEPNACINLLVAESLLLEFIVEKTVKELCVRQDLKSSAPSQRKKFSKELMSSNTLLSAIIV